MNIYKIIFYQSGAPHFSGSLASRFLCHRNQATANEMSITRAVIGPEGERGDVVFDCHNEVSSLAPPSGGICWLR